MHPRNPYKEPPDFLVLADDYPLLKPHLVQRPNGSTTINFNSDASQRRLTEALLHRDFGLSLTLRSDRLCPPIPNRLNYVLWIQDIMSAAPPLQGDVVRGIDIGTGASAIYPLLACKLEPNWEFTATDIDETSLLNARTNVDSNNLQDRIAIIKAANEGPILFPLATDTVFDFSMCNPPFYSSAEDVAQSAESKASGPSAICTGADVEMITPGGETAFVCQMVRESLDHKTKCRWYTSMLGKMSSLSEVIALLRQHSIENYAITEFVQGQTRRWAVGWSFTDMHLPDAIARISNPALQYLMAPRNTLYQSFRTATSGLQLTNALLAVLNSTDAISHTVITKEASKTSVHVDAKSNTWSRTARRKKKQSVLPSISASPTSSPSSAMRVCISWADEKPRKAGDQGERVGLELEFQWVQGSERSLFESFCSHISRKVEIGLSVK